MAGLESDEWYFLELTWDQDGGLKMYIDLRMVASDSRGFMREPAAGQGGPDGADSEQNYLYLGKYGGDMSDKTFGFFTVDDLDIWYATRSKLIELDFIARGLIPFSFNTFSSSLFSSKGWWVSWWFIGGYRMKYVYI